MRASVGKSAFVNKIILKRHEGCMNAMHTGIKRALSWIFHTDQSLRSRRFTDKRLCNHAPSLLPFKESKRAGAGWSGSQSCCQLKARGTNLTGVWKFSRRFKNFLKWGGCAFFMASAWNLFCLSPWYFRFRSSGTCCMMDGIPFSQVVHICPAHVFFFFPPDFLLLLSFLRNSENQLLDTTHTHTHTHT